jgi:hypothetical protein
MLSVGWPLTLSGAHAADHIFNFLTQPDVLILLSN